MPLPPLIAGYVPQPLISRLLCARRMANSSALTTSMAGPKRLVLDLIALVHAAAAMKKNAAIADATKRNSRRDHCARLFVNDYFFYCSAVRVS